MFISTAEEGAPVATETPVSSSQESGEAKVRSDDVYVDIYGQNIPARFAIIPSVYGRVQEIWFRKNLRFMIRCCHSSRS